MSITDVNYCRKCRKRIRIVDVHTGVTSIGECECDIPAIGASCRVYANEGTPTEPPEPGKVTPLRRNKEADGCPGCDPGACDSSREICADCVRTNSEESS